MRITSFEHGCEIMGIDPTALPIISMLPERHQKAILSSYKLFIISEASWKGEGKVIDWNNRSQDKWSGYFWMNKPGFRFLGTRCDYSIALTTSGSRLCYPSDEDAEYHLTTHIDLYRDLMVVDSE